MNKIYGFISLLFSFLFCLSSPFFHSSLYIPLIHSMYQPIFSFFIFLTHLFSFCFTFVLFISFLLCCSLIYNYLSHCIRCQFPKRHHSSTTKRSGIGDTIRRRNKSLWVRRDTSRGCRLSAQHATMNNQLPTCKVLEQESIRYRCISPINLTRITSDKTRSTLHKDVTNFEISRYKIEIEYTL
jgi:hypothetical protein